VPLTYIRFPFLFHGSCRVYPHSTEWVHGRDLRWRQSFNEFRSSAFEIAPTMDCTRNGAPDRNEFCVIADLKTGVIYPIP
jgi:hypothetical protein